MAIHLYEVRFEDGMDCRVGLRPPCNDEIYSGPFHAVIARHAVPWRSIDLCVSDAEMDCCIGLRPPRNDKKRKAVLKLGTGE